MTLIYNSITLYVKVEIFSLSSLLSFLELGAFSIWRLTSLSRSSKFWAFKKFLFPDAYYLFFPSWTPNSVYFPCFLTSFSCFQPLYLFVLYSRWFAYQTFNSHWGFWFTNSLFCLHQFNPSKSFLNFTNVCYSQDLQMVSISLFLLTPVIIAIYYFTWYS